MAHIGFPKHTLFSGWMFLLFTLLLIFALLICTPSQAQNVSQFDFNSTATLMTATIGPNGTAINPATVAPTGVAYITSGCGGPIGMDLVVPGATYDLANIRIRANFRRGNTEGTGSFFERGTFDFGFAEGYLFASYRVYDGGPGYTDYFLGTSHWVSTTAFHEYEFNYDNCSGVAQILDNGIVVASQFTGSGRNLYWIGAGDAMIGARLDNACNQTPGYDYTIIGGNTLGCLILPVEWGAFTGEMTQQRVELNWTTLKELNNDHFIVEHSSDGLNFKQMGKVPAIGNSESPTNYQLTDPSPFAGQTFYRIRQVDTEGLESHSEVIQVKTELVEPIFYSYPNPSGHSRWIVFQEMPGETSIVEVFDLNGRLVKMEEIANQPRINEHKTDWEGLNPGIYILQVRSGAFKETERIIVQ